MKFKSIFSLSILSVFSYFYFFSITLANNDIQTSPTSSTIKHYKGLEGVYLRPEILTEEAAEKYLSDIKSWGAKQVFLEAQFDNKVLNSSKIFPPFDENKDWLKIYCDLAKKYDLKINVWIKVCFWVHKADELNNFPILKQHPEWIDLNKNGKMVTTEGTYEEQHFIYVNPAVPEVKNAICDYVKEVAKYDISGISIDYIRFKACRDDVDTWFGFNKYSVEKFKKETGIDPINITYDSNPNSKFMQWVKYNEQVIEDCVGAIAQTIQTINKQEGKEIILSASPFTGYISGKSPKFQNWSTWDNKGYINLWLPMCMSLDMQLLEKEINELKNLNLKAPYYPIVYPNKHGSVHPPMKDHYEVLQKCKIEKFCVFSYKQLKEDF